MEQKVLTGLYGVVFFNNELMRSFFYDTVFRVSLKSDLLF